MDSLSKYFIKGELIEAMALTYFNRENNCSMCVNPDPNRVGNEYFKFCNNYSWSKATKLCRVSFRSPRYIVHTNSRKIEDWTLSKKEQKFMIRCLLEQSKKYKGHTVWQALIIDYNNERYAISVDETERITLAFQKDLGLKSELSEYEKLMLIALPIDLPMPNYLKLH